MKTQKLTQKNGTKTLITIVGLVSGFMLGGAVSAAVPTEHRTVARVAVAGGGALANASIKDDDGLGSFVKAAGLGASAREVYGLATDQLKKDVVVDPEADTLKRAYYGSIGLACPCGDQNDYWKPEDNGLNYSNQIGLREMYPADEPFFDENYAEQNQVVSLR
tara:strand:+ start:397 stop:885 length:489 start_codon:yes stop_codon:yes gene_type:complete